MIDPIENQKIIICDLDHTLISSDLLAESLIKLIQNKWYLVPYYFFVLIFILLMKGKAGVKIFIAKKVQIEPDSLLYRSSVLQYLREQKNSGAYLVLASASAQNFLNEINLHLKIFDAVFGTSENLNLKGQNKLDYILKIFNDRSFTYIGDSYADIPIWQKASERFVVATNSRINKITDQVEQLNVLETIPSVSWLTLIKVLRPHQWAKNFLIFVPFFTAHLWDQPQIIFDVFIGFLSFSIVASSVYVLNDLADIESDRQHRTKKNRPFASGQLNLFAGFLIAPLLLLLGISLAGTLSYSFFLVVLLYFMTTTLYSFWLKKITLVDILTLASLYTLRLFAGAVLVSVVISQWLLAFSMFLFFSLAALKRFTEVSDARLNDKKEIKGRGYTPNDLEIISQLGITSGLVSVLVLALYVNSPEVSSLYTNQMWLWGLCPLFFYWISRLWLKAYRYQMHDDPIVFALKDSASIATGLLIVVFGILAL